MSCLHLVSFGRDSHNRQRLLQALADTDALLLMGAALALVDTLQDLPQPLYLWPTQPNVPVHAAGTAIDADRLVALSLQYDKSMSWHD